MNRHYFKLLIVFLVVFTACSDDDPKEIIYPRVDIELSEEQKEINRAGISFAWELFEKVYTSSTDKNILISPLGVSYALGMLQNGAEGETLQEILSATCMDGHSLAAINGFYRHLADGLVEADRGTVIGMQHSFWHNNNFSLKQYFTDVNKSTFGMTVEGVDFGDPNTVRRINEWGSENTEGKIPQPITSIQPDDFFQILSSVYLKKNWSRSFDKNKTKQGIFIRSDQSTVNTMFMEDERKRYTFYENEVFKASSLPIGNGSYEMIFILPNEKENFTNTISKIKDDRFSHIYSQDAKVHYFVPSFECSYGLDMKEVLQSMGIEKVFGQSAELGKMTDQAIYASGLLQKAYLKIDEEGNESAILSAVSGRTLRDATPPPMKDVTFRLDRPFLYGVREVSTGCWLFIGSMDDPTQR